MSLQQPLFYAWESAPHGFKIRICILPEGRGFIHELYDAKDNLYRRDTTPFETVGAARRAAMNWLSLNEDDLT